MGLMEYNTDWKAIQQRFLPCKSKHQGEGGRRKANIIVPLGIRAQGWLVMADLLWKLLFVGMKVKNVTMEDGKKNKIQLAMEIMFQQDFLCYPIEVNKALHFCETKEQGEEFGGCDRFFVFPFGQPNNGGDREVEAKELQGIPSGCFLRGWDAIQTLAILLLEIRDFYYNR
ncbi:hypothetical protein U1Q18_036492 [Sarracenia purpurea var. burkii]